MSRYRNRVGLSFIDQIQNKISEMDDETIFSIEYFPEFPTNVSAILSKLDKRSEIILVEKRKIPNTRTTLRFYRKSSFKLKKERVVITFQGWEKVFPEFFILPEFKELGIIKVGERL